MVTIVSGLLLGILAPLARIKNAAYSEYDNFLTHFLEKHDPKTMILFLKVKMNPRKSLNYLFSHSLTKFAFIIFCCNNKRIQECFTTKRDHKIQSLRTSVVTKTKNCN